MLWASSSILPSTATTVRIAIVNNIQKYTYVHHTIILNTLPKSSFHVALGPVRARDVFFATWSWALGFSFESQFLALACIACRFVLQNPCELNIYVSVYVTIKTIRIITILMHRHWNNLCMCLNRKIYASTATEDVSLNEEERISDNLNLNLILDMTM